jgi:hypothetical protein
LINCAFRDQVRAVSGFLLFRQLIGQLFLLGLKFLVELCLIFRLLVGLRG